MALILNTQYRMLPDIHIFIKLFGKFSFMYFNLIQFNSIQFKVLFNVDT